MALSKVEICRRALLAIGNEGIISLDEEKKASEACDLLYEGILASMLEEHPWEFSMKRANLGNPLAEKPVFGYDYQYILPSDCKRVEETSPNIKHIIEDGKLLTDARPPLFIRYASASTDPKKFSALFVDAFVFRLAAELVEVIRGSDATTQRLLAQYNNAIRKAKAYSSMKGERVYSYPSAIVSAKY